MLAGRTVPVGLAAVRDCADQAEPRNAIASEPVMTFRELEVGIAVLGRLLKQRLDLAKRSTD
jgi:hypothetical protein